MGTMKGLALALGLGLVVWLCGCASGPSEGRRMTMDARVEQFVPAVISADLATLPDTERAALALIIAASRLLDDVFLRQAYAANPQVRERLAQERDRDAAARLAYFDIMRGPWDRQADWEPFAIDEPRPAGAGFYPVDMTKDEFEAACSESEERRAALTSLFTIVVRSPEGRLEAVPYSKAYGEWLMPAARLLDEAAAVTKDAALERFLRSRAAAFRIDDYYASDKAWMDLSGRVEVTIGPYEVYEDTLFGYKAAFESFVTVSDPVASEALARYKANLLEWEQALPLEDRYKTERGRESPVRVADLVYASGDARTSVQTIAFNLPNDERVRAEKGAKKVLLRNVIQAKFDQIMRPLAERVLDPGRLPLLSAEAFFNQTLFHELSHSLGPAFVEREGRREEVRMLLGSAYSAIEELKADVMGAFLVQHEIGKGTFPESFRDVHLVSYLVGLFRSVRFGLAEAHGKGAAIQINRYLAAGAATVDPETGVIRVDTARLPEAIRTLLREVLMIQAEGDAAAAERLLAREAVTTSSIAAVLARLDDVPVDLRPIYPAAGERP